MDLTFSLLLLWWKWSVCEMQIWALATGLARLMKLTCDFLCLLKGFDLLSSVLLEVREMMFLVECTDLSRCLSAWLRQLRSFSSVENFLKKRAEAWDFSELAGLLRVDSGLYIQRLYFSYIAGLRYIGLISHSNASPANNSLQGRDLDSQGDYLFVGLIIIEFMNPNPLLGEKGTPVEPSLSAMAIITRYNIFIDVYNKPNCIVDEKALHRMPTSHLHDQMFLLLNDWKGKILFFVLICLPILDCFLALLAAYCFYVYWKCLNIHDSNQQIVKDPFKNMVFDPELCFKLHKDYYAFAIEFKQLQGFSLNYNKDVRKQLSLRQQRGRANFMIYNANFWSSYHHFGRWRKQHLSFLLGSIIGSAALNIIFFVYIV